MGLENEEEYFQTPRMNKVYNDRYNGWWHDLPVKAMKISIGDTTVRGGISIYIAYSGISLAHDFGVGFQ